MKGMKAFPGLVRPRPSAFLMAHLVEWTFRELCAQQRWRWYMARRPMAFVWAVPPSVN